MTNSVKDHELAEIQAEMGGWKWGWSCGDFWFGLRTKKNAAYCFAIAAFASCILPFAEPAKGKKGEHSIKNLQKNAGEHQFGDGEVDDDASCIENCGHEWSRCTCGVDVTELEQEGQHGTDE